MQQRSDDHSPVRRCKGLSTRDAFIEVGAADKEPRPARPVRPRTAAGGLALVASEWVLGRVSVAVGVGVGVGVGGGVGVGVGGSQQCRVN